MEFFWTYLWPLIIILAFAIIFMSIVVISVVYGKFDTELKRIRSGRGVAGTTSFARASVLMSAVLLGIANMRKRKFRTALTSITIVLITFAVLCFTSASRYLDTTTLPTGVLPWLRASAASSRHRRMKRSWSGRVILIHKPADAVRFVEGGGEPSTSSLAAS